MSFAGQEIPDAYLASRAAGGDRDAFEQLFDRHVRHVAAVCRQRLRTQTDIDDAVQETFTRALAHLHQLHDGASFGRWVRSIAVRACTDHHRATMRSVVTPVEELDLTDANPQPDELVVASEHSASVRRSLAQLGPRDAHALWLRHVAGVPVTAVADELGLTPGSARVLLTRARHRLRDVTSLLPALLPLSWRQWFRTHLPACTPALDAMVAIVTFGLVAGTVGFPASPAPRPEQGPASVQIAHDPGVAREGHPAVAAAARSDRDADRDADRAQAAGNRRPVRNDRLRAREDGEQSTDDVTVADAVTVTNRYPRADEAEHLASVRASYGGEKLGEVRVYGNAPKPVKQTRRALPGPSQDGVAAGDLHVGPGGDETSTGRR